MVQTVARNWAIVELVLPSLACRMVGRTSKSRQFTSVKEWLLYEIQRRKSLTDKGRKRLSRARSSMSATAPVKLRAGRLPRASVTVASAQRAKKRQAAAAARVLPAIAAELVRLRVVGKSSLPVASDIRRGLRSAVEFRALAPRAPVALLTCLFYERAWREPRLSRRLLTAFQKALQTTPGAADAAWQAITTTRRLAPADKPNHRYWQGPAALNAARGPWMWQRSEIEDLAKELYRSRARVDAETFVTKLSSLPYVSAYFAFTYLRMVETLGIVQLRNCEKVAATMSGTVPALTDICPVSDWFANMRRLPGVDKDFFTLGDTTLLICETAKALQSLGFQVPRPGLVSVNAVLQTAARAHPNGVKPVLRTASRPFCRRQAYCWRPCSNEPSALAGEVESGAGSVGAPPQPAATMRQKRPQQLVNRSRGEGLEMSRARQSVPSQPSIRKGALPWPSAQTLPTHNQGEKNKCDSFYPSTARCV